MSLSIRTVWEQRLMLLDVQCSDMLWCIIRFSLSSSSPIKVEKDILVKKSSQRHSCDEQDLLDIYNRYYIGSSQPSNQYLSGLKECQDITHNLLDCFTFPMYIGINIFSNSNCFNYRIQKQKHQHPLSIVLLNSILHGLCRLIAFRPSSIIFIYNRFEYILWMEQNYYHSRLDKAKQMLMAGRKEDMPLGESERKSESKKKKKHKDDRRSHSRSRDKKKRSHSKERSHEHKHKKEHKHREEREDRPQHENREHRDKDRERRNDNPDRRNDNPERRNDNPERRNDNPERRDHYRDQGRQDSYRGGQDRRDNYRKDERTLEEKDPYYERRKQIERARIVNPKEAQQLEMDLEKQILFDKKEKELEEAKEKFRQAQKEMEEAKREDHTILVYCLPLKAKERDIWNFFSKANCGKIRDIRIIKDARSGRSKGVAYVEFYTSDAVQKALTMTDRPFELKGRQFMGLRVQHSQAEKNRAAAAAKHMRVIKPVDPLQQQQEIIRRQTKVVVGGLIDNLAEMQESELKELFEPFGEIQYVDIHRDPQTGRCKGFAFIQYANTECAKAAVKDMNGLVIRKQKISVQTVNVAQRGEVSASDEFIYSAGTKANLRNQLASGMSGPSHSNLQRPPISTVTTPYLIMTNMFKMQGTTPHYFDELKKEIQKQVEVYGTVERIFIEKNNQGNIWIKYSDTESAKKCQDNLNGKFFDNHKIFCYFVTENTYQNRVGI